MKKKLETCFWWFFSVTFFISRVISAQAQELTEEDLGAFFDGFVPLQIGQADVAGAVIAVVKDGKLLFAKGYGYADVANKELISPETTLFRPGSISKLFTWTSVMQQVELGKLDLDRDVNDYLDFKIPPAFGKPITLRDIMTHRTGFEEVLKDLMFIDKDLQTLSEYLQTHMPARIFPPGTIPAYSNYATTIAAYIVERVSGQNFNDYVEQHILNPLEMHHSTFRQPLAEAYKPFMSKGYMLGSEGPKPFEIVQVAPAGSLTATAVDMTNFMIMHLQNGRFKDKQILKTETAIQMHARQEGWPKEMHAMCLGFYEQSENDHRVIGHGGDTNLFHSNLSLILDANVGLFVSYNSTGKSTLELRGVLFNYFMDRYFPEIIKQEPELATDMQEVQNVVGSYESSRRSETNFLAIVNLLAQSKVTANEKDHTLSMSDFKGLNQKPLHFREIAPMVFREVDGHAKIAFVKDADGRHVAYVGYPFMVYQQVIDIFDRQTLNYFILGFSLLVILLTLLAWPIAALIRNHYNKPLLLSTKAKWLRIIVYGVCLIILIYMIGAIFFITRFSDYTTPTEQNDLYLRSLQILGVVVGLGSLVAVYYSIYSWIEKRWVWSKIWNTFLALACLGFFWFIYHWSFLNFHLKY